MAATAQNATDELLLLVGSYTEAYGTFRARGEGLSLVALRPDGSLALQDLLELCNPAYVRVHPSSGLAYVALETNDGRTDIAVVKIEAAQRRLRLLGTVPLSGSILCHLDLHPTADWIAGACYGSGHVAVRRIGADGLPNRAHGPTINRVGSSIHSVRQTSSHPHAARFSPDGRWLVVPDLGTDEVTCYSFEPETGAVGHKARPQRMEPGSGPRMALFDPSGFYLVLVHELSSSVSAFAWEDGRLRRIGLRSTLVAPYAGPNTASGLRWHPSGRAFAVSNRGADRIALFRFDPGTGEFEPWCECASGGIKPRDFDFTPCGHWLVAANQDSDSLVVLAVDLHGGQAGQTGVNLGVRSPSCVRAVPVAHG